MKIQTEIGIFELAGEKCDTEVNRLRVLNHWNDRDRVVLQWGGGNAITVIADDLIRAIKNAQNHR